MTDHAFQLMMLLISTVIGIAVTIGSFVLKRVDVQLSRLEDRHGQHREETQGRLTRLETKIEDREP